MAQQRDQPTYEVDGIRITALAATPAEPTGRPLIAALHGDTYTARYFDVPGGPEGSFLDTATAHGHPVVTFDRPGYGGSTPLAPADNTFARHAELLAGAVAQAVERSGADQLLLVGHSVDRERGEREALRLVDGMAGSPVQARVVSTDPWTARMQIVDRMRRGRVFLAGDAAHLNPPFGGHGLNTGIGDAVDLGWKLAAVLTGWAGPRVLDSYEAERRPVQERVIREATANMRVLSTELLADNLEADDAAGAAARAAAAARVQETKRAEFHSLDLVLGLRIEDSPILPPAPGSAQVGARLPHLFLPDGRSLYDLLGEGLTLLAPPGADTAALVEAARLRSVPLTVVELPTAAGAPGAPLLLVRPDQVVGWTGTTTPPDSLALIDRLTGHPAPAATPR